MARTEGVAEGLLHDAATRAKCSETQSEGPVPTDADAAHSVLPLSSKCEVSTKNASTHLHEDALFVVASRLTAPRVEEPAHAVPSAG